MRALSAVELYKELEEHFKVTSSYKMGFSKELSPEVLEVIKHLKGDLNPEDIVPIPTELTIVLKNKENTKIIDTFYQSSAVYMESFDKNAYQEFCTNNLINKLADVPHTPTAYHQQQTNTH